MSTTNAPYLELGHFQLLELLRDGTFDVVYSAFDHRNHRLVAIKLPLTRTTPLPADVQRFFQEGVQLSRLNHPGVVPVSDMGQIKGVLVDSWEQRGFSTMWPSIIDNRIQYAIPFILGDYPQE